MAIRALALALLGWLGCAWSLRLSMSTTDIKARTTIKIASETDFPLVARFLSEAMYGPDVPNGQRKELARLELIDLRDRYGSTVGKRKFPAALIVAEEDEEVVGCVGLDCQLFDQKGRKFSKLKPGVVVDSNGMSDRGEVAVVLSNLAVRVDKRGQGVASQLIGVCEDFAGQWQREAVYLLVDSENAGAQKLYKKQ
ncbi:acyl-CoA N-acyltransferase, partial [Ochromonadaceae sp. CCMP2298]